MTVDLKDIESNVVFSQTLQASQHPYQSRDRD